MYIHNKVRLICIYTIKEDFYVYTQSSKTYMYIHNKVRLLCIYTIK